VTAGPGGAFSTTVTIPAVSAGTYRIYAVGHLSLSAPSAAYKVT